jgi:hypothetical protein
MPSHELVYFNYYLDGIKIVSTSISFVHLNLILEEENVGEEIFLSIL